MADILPPLAQAADSSWILFFIFLPPTLLLVFYVWRKFTQPLAKLTRELRKGKLSPRKTAHRLAQLPLKNQELLTHLDSLRFGQASPSHEDVFALLRRVKNDR